MPALHTPGAIEHGQDVQAAALAAMRAEGLEPYSWSNRTGYLYAAHRHPYDKVLYCITGSIRLELPAEGTSLELQAGDRLDLAAGTDHVAIVGPNGVTCLEAAR